MRDEVLSEKQRKLLPLLKKFAADFGLIGGTAIALHLGHRRSIDFDLATTKMLHYRKLRETIQSIHRIENVLVDQANEQTILIDNVKLTFLKYPFPIVFSQNLGDFIRTPDLTTLAAMKAYALGRRAKWKDYVDLYFILKTISFNQIIAKAKSLYKNEFNEKLFREQLVYFEDIDRSEAVEFLPGFQVEERKIKRFLQEISLTQP